jgi:hypothetical protein
MTKCKACKADILWVDMPTGKKMPLDAQPCKMVIVKDGIGEIVDAYTPHWATCPGADQFRRK